MELFIEKRKVVLDVYERYKYKIPNIREDIQATASKMLMSKDRHVSFYGMFLPHEDMKYSVVAYKGKLVQNPEEADFKYYFDNQNRVILTERYGEHDIFFFYLENCVEIVWYHRKRNRICKIAKFDISEETINKFLETRDLVENVEETNRDFSFYEYTYHYKENELELHYQSRYMMSDGELRVRSKIERYRYPD
jgi:hypothetical protein